MTKGNITKLLIAFAVPMLLGNIFQLFYNLADTRIVGENLGKNALGALGTTSALNSMIIGFLNGMTNGFSIVTARFFGAKDEKSMRKTVAISLVLGLMISAVFTVLSLNFMDVFLRKLSTPQNFFEDAKAYITVIMAGMTLTMLYNLFSAILRAVGDTVSPLIFLIVSTIINIVLDLLFIKSFHMGVKGAAYATVIAQGVSVVLCIIYVIAKHKELIPKRDDFKPDFKLAGNMLATGTSMGLMISLVCIGSVIMQGAINSFDSDTIVAHTTARKISEIYFLPISVFGAAAATMTSQNYGAKEIQRVKQGIWKATLLTWGWSMIVTVLSFLCTPQIATLITSITDKNILGIVDKYMKINTSFYLILTLVIIFRNALQGMDDKISPMLSSVLELVGKVWVAKKLAPKLGYLGIIVSEPLVWIGMAVILGIGLIIKNVKMESLNS